MGKSKALEWPDLKGARLLAEWFGFWPSFHDAEILSLDLSRHGLSKMQIHTWTSSGALEPGGRYDQIKDVVVEFQMGGIINVDLGGFNHQNVIFGLDILPYEVDSIPHWRVQMDCCYGLCGFIVCQDLVLRLIPGKPQADE